MQYSTVHHSTAQYSAGQYSTVQHLDGGDGADADGGDDEVVEGPGPDDQVGPKLIVLKPAGHYPQDCEEDLKCSLLSKNVQMVIFVTSGADLGPSDISSLNSF